MMRDTVVSMLVIHILFIVVVILDVPILRQCVGFVFLTFLPGFVILHALGIKNDSVAVELSLSVTVSVAFVMFIGLLINTLYPLLGIPAPLSTLPFVVTISVLTFAVFMFSQIRETNVDSNKYLRFFHTETSTKGVVLCAVSIALLSLSIVGALCHSVLLLILPIAGTAAVLASGFFLRKSISSGYYTFALYVVSLSLLLQMSLLTRHIMGWDIFGEYSEYRLVRAAGYWASPGVVPTYDPSSNLNSILSISILPTAYSNVLNLDGELIFKTIYPFIFCFVPILLFKAYETQLGKIVALLSVFFYIADPINFYSLEVLSLAREMIAYLFLSGMIFCFAKRDMDLRTRRLLIIMFSAGLAVSHYSLAFLTVFLLVSVYVAIRITGKKDPPMDLALVLSIVGITFTWYMYVATPPFNNLTDAFNNVASKLATDLFNSQNRVDPGMTPISPIVEAMSLVGLMHKVIIYISEFFVAVGAVILAFRPREFRFHPVTRWMGTFASLVLLVCLAVPNVAPILNFSRFYRYIMIFLAPLFTLGGVYFLGLFRKTLSHHLNLDKKSLKDLRLKILMIFLVVFFLFRSGFVNVVTGTPSSSYKLDFNKLEAPDLGINSVYIVYVPEQDISSAKWLALHVPYNYSVYADYRLGIAALIDYTTIRVEHIRYIENQTRPGSGSYIYLRTLNAVLGILESSRGNFNLSDLSPSVTQNCRIYSNGASDVYFVP